MTPTNISPFLIGQLEKKANGKVVAPDNIIQSVAGAYTEYSILRQDHVDRVALYAALEGLIAGNPPYDQDELDANGFGHIANFNNFKGRSYYERGAQAYWNLLNSTEVFIKIWLNGKDPQFSRWATYMARNLSDVIKLWPDFHTNTNLLGSQLTKFGLSPVFWPDEESWMWEVVDVSKFLIPSQTETTITKLTKACIEITYTVQKLYQIYTLIGDEPKSDWNKEALGNFLIYRANSMFKQDGQAFTDFLSLQRFINNHSAQATVFFSDIVRLVHLFQEEYTGGVSHYIFDRERIAAAKFTSEALEGGEDFLFFVDRQYKDIQQVLVIFTASPGEWTIHGNLGIGQKTFAGTQAVNMLDCAVLDMARMSSTPLVRTLATGGRDANAIKFIPGIATDLGAAEFVQNQLGTNINQLVLASQYLTQGMDTNAINAGDDPSQPDRSQGSIAPSQARNRAFNEFGTLKNNISHFYLTFDVVIKNMVIRLLNCKEGTRGYEYKKEWIERCEFDGVPREMFDTTPVGLQGLPRQFRTIKATRVAGDGSTVARIMGLDALQPIAGTFNAKEMSAYKKDYVEATLGPDYIETYAASDDQADEHDGGASLAGLENFVMQQGGTPVFSIDNEHVAHAATHMALNMDTIQQLQGQKISPVDADKIFQNSIPHTQLHIQAMQKAPLLYREALQKIEPAFGQVLKLAELNRKNAESMVQAEIRKQQEDAVKTQQVLDDSQRKDVVAAHDMKLKDEKQTASIERNKETVKQRGQIMREKVRADADVGKLKAQLDAEVKGATAKGRTQLDLEKSPPEDLQSQLAGMTGSTPSAIDFEKEVL